MTKHYLTYAMATALTVALSLTIMIPIPAVNGMVSLVDAGIFTSAFLFGPLGGFFVGALSGGLLDLFAGYIHWAVFSFLIHGLQAYLAGHAKDTKGLKKWLVLAAACWVMVGGYFLVSWMMYGWGAALGAILSDSVQVGVGLVIALPLSHMLKKTLPFVKSSPLS